MYLDICNENRSLIRANELIKGIINSTKNEYKLVLYTLTKIQKSDQDFRHIKISVKEFADVLGIRPDHIYEDFDKYMTTLRTQAIKIKDDKNKKDKSGKNKRIEINWFSYVKYYDGQLEIGFNNDLAPFLLQIDTSSTEIFYNNIKNMDSLYAIRTYELLKVLEEEEIHSKVIELDEYKETIGISEEYKQYGIFKKRILEKSTQEINNKSDIKVNFHEIKTGKKITHIQWNILSVKDKADPNTEAIALRKHFCDLTREEVSLYDIKGLIEKQGIEKVKEYFYKVDLNKLFQKSHKWSYLKVCIEGDYKNVLIQDFQPDAAGCKKKSPRKISTKVPQELNYEQRSYDDDFYKSLYHNK